MTIGFWAPLLSAFSAYGAGTQIAAHNLANIMTNGFKSRACCFSDLSNQSGVRAAAFQQTSAGGPLAQSVIGALAGKRTESVVSA